MAGKYDALTQYLDEQPADEPVSLTFDEIDSLIGGLPPSAAKDRPWWANTWGHPHSAAWMRTGRKITEVQLGRHVVFSPADADTGPPPPGRSSGQWGLPAVADGVVALREVLERAGYPSVVQAVAAHTLFLHPETVAQAGREPMFPVVRDPTRRATFGELDDGRRVMFDDNNTPTLCVLWATQRTKGPDVQYNHVWGDPRNVDTYTALWNLCITPAFLAKTTDGSNHPEVVAALRWRAFELYGYKPEGEELPKRPAAYDECTWPDPPPPVKDLEAVFRRRLAAAPKSRPALAARRCGWRFSAWAPDVELDAT